MLAERRPAGEQVSQCVLVVEMAAVLRFCRVVRLAHFVEHVEGAGRAADEEGAGVEAVARFEVWLTGLWVRGGGIGRG